MPRFLVTTFERLLLVDLDRDWTLNRVRVLHEGRGIYFGLARDGRRIWVAERNLDIHKMPRAATAPVNGIALWHRGIFGGFKRSGMVVTNTAFEDLHQIAYDQGAHFITTSRPPFLVRRDLATGHVTDVSLEDALPARLRRPEGGNLDRYHVNSVAVSQERLWVLAHNWDRPSFALSMDRTAAHMGRAEAVEIHENVGSCAHDVLPDGNGAWVLDSAGAALVRIGSEQPERFSIDGTRRQPFPRGLARNGRKLLLTHGFWSAERDARAQSDAMARVFDICTGEMGPPMLLGAHGNTCAVMAI